MTPSGRFRRAGANPSESHVNGVALNTFETNHNYVMVDRTLRRWKKLSIGKELMYPYLILINDKNVCDVLANVGCIDPDSRPSFYARPTHLF